MGSDTSPLLTETQREVLKNVSSRGSADTQNKKERVHRSNIQTRVRGVIEDFPFLLETLSRGDRRRMFEDLYEYRAFRERHRKAEEEGEPSISTEPTASEARGQQLYEGIVGLLAFLYLGIDNRHEFEEFLEAAIRAAQQEDMSVVVDPTVKIETERVGRDELVEGILSRGLGPYSIDRVENPEEYAEDFAEAFSMWGRIPPSFSEETDGE